MVATPPAFVLTGIMRHLVELDVVRPDLITKKSPRDFSFLDTAELILIPHGWLVYQKQTGALHPFSTPDLYLHLLARPSHLNHTSVHLHKSLLNTRLNTDR